MLAAAASIAGLPIEIERANGRWPLACARDGAAPLIGSTSAIRLVRERIEKVAVTDFGDSSSLFIEEPTMSPDGRYLFYNRGHGGSSIWMLTLQRP